MRILTFLSSTALATALLTTGFMAGDALAQKGVTLNPATDWAVTQIADKTGGGADYCALARRFKQDTVLTLARNSNSETSFALDFQRPKLDSSRPISVTLDPGAGQQRVYDIKPVSNSAFVVRLGHDRAFFGALEKTGHLRVEADGQSYSFNLADIDTGQFRLDSCIASMIVPAAGDESPEPLVQAQAGQPSTTAYKQDVNGLRRQIQDLKEENLKLSNLLSQSAPAAAMPSGPSAEEVAAAAALSDRVDELQTENQVLRDNLEYMKKSNAMTTVRDESAGQNAQDTAENAAKVAALNAEIAQLKADNLKLQNVSAVGGDSSAALAALQAENAGLKERLEKAQAEVAIAASDAGASVASSGAETVALKEQIKALEIQNAALKVSVAEGASAQASVASAEAQLAALKLENARLQESAQAQEGNQLIAEEIEGQIKALQTKNEELTQKLAQAQVEAQTAQAGEIEKAHAENAKLKSMLDKKGVDADLLEQLRQQIGQMQAENSLLQETAGKAQAELEQKKTAEIDALKAELEAQKTAAAAQQGNIEEVARLQAKIDALTAEMAKKETELVAAAKAALDIEALKLKNIELEQKLTEASTAAAKDAQAKASVAELEAKVLTLEAGNASLKKELETVAATAATAGSAGAEQITAAQAEVAKLKIENEKLQAQLTAAAGASSSTEELKAALAENAALTMQVQASAELKNKFDALQQEHEALKLAQAEQQKAGAATAAAELTTAQEATKALVAENEQLKAKVSALEVSTATSDMQTQMQALQVKNDEITKSLEKALSDAKTYQEQVVAKDKEIAAAQEEKKQLMASLEQKGGEHADLAALQGQVEGLKGENQTLLMRVAELEAAAVATATVAQATPASVTTPDPAIQEKIGKLEADNAGLKTELEKAQGELKQAVSAAPQSQDRIKELESKLDEAARENERLRLKAQGLEQASATVPAPQPQQAEPQPAQQVAELEPAGQPQELIPAAPEQEQPEPQGEPAPAPEPVAAAEEIAPPPQVAVVPEVPSEPAKLAADGSEVQQAVAPEVLDGQPYSAAQAMEARMTRELEEQQAVQQEQPQPQQQEAAVAESAPAAIEQETLPLAQAPASHPEQIEEPQEPQISEAQAMEQREVSRTAGLRSTYAGDDLEPVMVRRSEDPYAPFENMNADEQPKAAVADSEAPVQLSKPGRQEQVRQPEAAPVANNAVQSVLAAAQIVTEGNVERVEAASSADKAVYQWHAANVYGSAEEQKLGGEAEFDTHVKEYLERTEQRCEGDFAIMPDNTLQQGNTRIDSYEIACVGNNVNSAAAVVFYNNGGTFTTVAHEAPTEAMDEAMTLRDRLVQTLTGVSNKQASLKLSRPTDG